MAYNVCFDNLSECASYCNENNDNRLKCGFYDYYKKYVADYYLESLKILKRLDVIKC